MKPRRYNDHPIEDVMRLAMSRVADGWTVHQKFTCERCGSRQTVAEENQFFATGKCEECGHITDIAARGCNFLAISPQRKDTMQ